MASILNRLWRIKISKITQNSKYFAIKTNHNEIPVVNPDSTIKLSQNCVYRLQEICTDSSFLRVSVEGGGCSGFQYKFELDENINEDDISFGVTGAKVVIDKSSIEYCKGSIIDYHTELIRAGFRIVGNQKQNMDVPVVHHFQLKFNVILGRKKKL